jgi:hypothetical protein
VLSVYFMNRGYRKQHPRATNTASKLEEAFPEGIPVE